MSKPNETQDSCTIQPRTEHWLLELVYNGNREKTVLLEGRRKNIVSYIRSNTKYLFPFYEALFQMLDPIQAYDEIDMHISIYEFFNNTCDPFLEINSKKIEDFLKSVPDRDIIQIFNAKAVDISNYPVLTIRLSRLPPSWNTRPRKVNSTKSRTLRTMLEYTCLLSILEFLDLKGLYNLALTNVEMKDVVFDYIKRARIIDCKGDKTLYKRLVEDGYQVKLGMKVIMTAYGEVYDLELKELKLCPGITDVSSLGGVHHLDLSGCPGITDVSSLGGVHHLDLSGCTSITDVSALGGVTL